MIREINNFIFPGLGKATPGIAFAALHRSVIKNFLAIILLIAKGFSSEIAILNESVGLLA
jgi:hypothetical protein